MLVVVIQSTRWIALLVLAFMSTNGGTYLALYILMAHGLGRIPTTPLTQEPPIPEPTCWAGGLCRTAHMVLKFQGRMIIAYPIAPVPSPITPSTGGTWAGTLLRL